MKDGPPNKELKLTNLERIEGSQLNSSVSRTPAEGAMKPKARRTRRAEYRALGSAEQRYVAQYIHALVPTARQADHPMRDLARWLIAIAMWRWTADGVDQTGRVVKDAIKYNVRVHRSTRAAREAARTSIRGLRHEHIVPRDLLARRIIDGNLTVDEITALLTRCCKAVIVTREEDSQILPRKAMPPEWDWEAGDPYARYLHSKVVIDADDSKGPAG